MKLMEKVEGLIVGVDPGSPPQLALLSEKGELLELSYKSQIMGADKRLSPEKVVTLLGSWRKSWGSVYVKIVCETVSIRKGEGTSSALKYASSFYVMHGIAAAKKIPFCKVHPRRWKSWSDKKISLKLCRKTWPDQSFYFDQQKDHNRAEAALIALWSITEKKLEPPL